MQNLTTTQIQLFEDFVSVFLPKRGSKRKSSGNELGFVTSTLDRVFRHNFGFRLNRYQVIELFRNMQYDIYEVNATWDWDKKDYKPQKNGECTQKHLKPQKKGAPVIYESPYTYIDISAGTMRDLKSTFYISSMINTDKMGRILSLMQEIEKFKTICKIGR